MAGISWERSLRGDSGFVLVWVQVHQKSTDAHQQEFLSEQDMEGEEEACSKLSPLAIIC